MSSVLQSSMIGWLKDAFSAFISTIVLENKVGRYIDLTRMCSRESESSNPDVNFLNHKLPYFWVNCDILR